MENSELAEYHKGAQIWQFQINSGSKSMKIFLIIFFIIISINEAAIIIIYLTSVINHVKFPKSEEIIIIS